VGRCARLQDLEQAERAFQRGLEIADREGLGLWKIRALHELGTIDLLGKVSPTRLQAAHRQATAAGALATAATLDLQIASCHLTGSRVGQAVVAVDRCLEISRRFGLDPVYGLALVFRGWSLALRGDRPSMERVFDELPDPIPTADVAGGMWGVCRGVCSLVLEDHARAAEELERSDEILAGSPTTSPHASRGLWALLRLVEGTDGEAACAQIRASPAFVNTIVRGALSQAEAVVHGRAGRIAEADRWSMRAEAELSPGPWFLHIGHRLIAQEAFDHGWGEPERWLREGAAFFDEQQQDRVASACRSLLRKAGIKLSRRGRGDSVVPDELAARGVTSREMDVLTLVREGLSNAEIGERLFLSRRTVETHVSSLLRKSGTSNRLQLVAWAPRSS
jgi:DNA-binding CsgD family transcriptional regulator